MGSGGASASGPPEVRAYFCIMAVDSRQALKQNFTLLSFATAKIPRNQRPIANIQYLDLNNTDKIAHNW